MPLPTNVSDYLALSPHERLQLFLETNTHINKPANYYIDFSSTTKNVANHLSNLQKLSKDFHPHTLTDLNHYFVKNPNMLKLIPTLLAIRVHKNLDVLGNNTPNYTLDFTNPKNTLSEHLKFIKDSGLADFLINHPISNYVELAQGIEIGLNSNARKNRGGHLGETFLKNELSKFSTQIIPDKTKPKTIYTPLPNDLTFVTQGTIKVMQNAFNIDLTHSGIPTNRRFDGAVYKRSQKELTVLEINFFNSGGSKLKSVAGEFSNLQQHLTIAHTPFIYITSGLGWENDISHIKSAIENIKCLFNFEMVRRGYLQQLFEK